MTINALLVEDDHALASAVIRYLELENIACDYAPSGEIGLSLAKQHDFSVIVLDVNLPGLNGFDMCHQLRERGEDTPILMLTARDTVADKLTGFQMGTDDYLVKPFDMDELVARIRALSARRSVRATKLRLADLELDLSQKTATRGGKPIALTPTGWTLLETLVKESPNIVTKEQLEQAIWFDSQPDSNALKVHLCRLRQKVDKPFDTRLIHTLANRGFVARESTPDEK